MKKILLSLVLVSAIGFYTSAQLNLLNNGDCEEQGDWIISQENLLDPVSYEFGSTENTVAGGVGGNLAIKHQPSDPANHNIVIYQAVNLVGGEEYIWSCVMRDLSPNLGDCWWASYSWMATQPVDGSDVDETEFGWMNEWQFKTPGFNGALDTFHVESNIFVPEADAVYYVGVNVGACILAAQANLHFIFDEIELIDPDATSGINTSLSENGNALNLYPNPASTYMNFTFSISKNSKVELRLIDILGHEVATITNESRTKGTYTETFDCSDLADGVYYGVLNANNTTVTKKIIVLK